MWLWIAATADTVKLAVSDDAKQAQPSPTADFTFNFKEPLKTVPAVGSQIDVTGVYSSYTQTPLMIIMSDAAVVEKAPVKKTAAKKPAAGAARKPAGKKK